MTVSAAGGSAHNPSVKTEPLELTELRRRVNAVVDLCLGGMSGPSGGGLVDADTVWPTQVLEALGVDYGPGSELALRPWDER